MPHHGRPDERAYLDIPGWGSLRLNLVRGHDQDGRRLFYAYGPPNMPTPPVGAVRIECDRPYDRPEYAQVRLWLQIHEDRHGVTRFTPPAPVPHTNN